MGGRMRLGSWGRGRMTSSHFYSASPHEVGRGVGVRGVAKLATHRRLVIGCRLDPLGGGDSSCAAGRGDGGGASDLVGFGGAHVSAGRAGLSSAAGAIV